jgi:hypothetical protein
MMPPKGKSRRGRFSAQPKGKVEGTIPRGGAFQAFVTTFGGGLYTHVMQKPGLRVRSPLDG